MELHDSGSGAFSRRGPGVRAPYYRELRACRNRLASRDMELIREPCSLRHFSAGCLEQRTALVYDGRQIGIRNTTARSVPTATPGPTAADWSESKIVACGGQAGTGPGSAECPHVVRRYGWYYLFRTQRYGRGARTTVYRSQDPMDFGVEDDRFLVCTLAVAAPEVIRHQRRDYIASLLPSLKGIRIARLGWAAEPAPR